MAGIETGPADYAISGTGQASIRSRELVNKLIKEQGVAIKTLRKVAPSITIDEVSIDQYGRVVIENDEFEKYVKEIIQNPIGAVGQGVCGAGCGSSREM